MRHGMIRALILPCLGLCLGLASSAADTKKSVPVRDRSIAPPYWFHYPQFTDAEVRVVVNWFQDGLQANRLHIASIPVALAREIHIGAKLTVNMVKSLAAPPEELVAKLLPLPEGYQRLLAGSVLLIIKSDEALVVDTLPVGGR
jgi:hypothetical protein